MTILALEFSSEQRSVAVARGEKVLAEAFEQTETRGTNAFGLIEKVLTEAKIEREEIETIAVGLGPGSYTGVRAAIALAQGWRLARGIKLTGISSVEAMAARAQTERIFGRVNVVVDAQRNEFYLAGYEIAADGWKEIGPLRIVSVAEVRSLADAGEILVGSEMEKSFPDGRRIFPSAAMLARLSARTNRLAAEIFLEPIYLRETNFVKSSTAEHP